VKAEFLELLEQREKQVVELETALKSLQASLAAAGMFSGYNVLTVTRSSI
jgi:hypothetical protein